MSDRSDSVLTDGPPQHDADSYEVLQRRVVHLELFYDLTDLLNRSTDLQLIFHKTLATLQQSVGADRASILLFDTEGRMRFHASIGLSEQYRKDVEGHSPWKQHDGHAKAILVRNVEQDLAGDPLLHVVLQEGIRALAFIPLASHGRLLGKFMLYYNAPFEFPSEDVRIAQSIADHVALAVDRKRRNDQIESLNEALVHRVEEYERVVRDLQQSRADLEEKVHELERFEEVVVGRELKMMQLEKELQRLKSHPPVP